MLVTDEYKKQLEQYHTEHKNWGSGPRAQISRLGKFFHDNNVLEVVDYGCGKATNMKFIFPIKIHSYDPGVPTWSADPPCAPYLICMDVLEHIEPELLEDVLQHIDSKFTRKALLGISMSPAKETLPDGRNAHLIQKPVGWWLERLQKYFYVETIEIARTNGSFIATLNKV